MFIETFDPGVFPVLCADRVRLLDGPQTLAIAYAAPRSLAVVRALTDLQRQLPQAVWIGGSTAGELTGGRLLDDSLAVALVRFEHTRLVAAEVSLREWQDSYIAGFSLGQSLAMQCEGQPLRSVFLVGAGSSIDGQALAEGMRQALPSNVVISGGLAGDGTHFEKPWTLGTGGPTEEHVRAVGLIGDRLRIATSCARGWLPFGPTRRITRCSGNVLFELDGMPALDLYRRYLGNLAHELPSGALRFPLEVRGLGADNEPLVRTVLSVNHEIGSMTFAGTLQQAGTARLMRASRSDLVDSASTAARDLYEGWPHDVPALTTVVSCVGRRLVLGSAVEDELTAMQTAAPAQSRQIGFCSYGELAPAGQLRTTRLHNQSIALTAWGEA